jgi:hypothetical protein
VRREGFQKNQSVSHPVRALESFERLLVLLLAILKHIANGAHSSAMEAFYSLNTAVGNDAMNKFGTCRQWRYERSPILATEQ